MAKGYKTGGRTEGVPNRDGELKLYLKEHSREYYRPSVYVDDDELAEALRVPRGSCVSRFDIDLAAMTPSDRAAIHEKILRYHTPQLKAESVDLNIASGPSILEQRLASLCPDPDDDPED